MALGAKIVRRPLSVPDSQPTFHCRNWATRSIQTRSMAARTTRRTLTACSTTSASARRRCGILYIWLAAHHATQGASVVLGGGRHGSRGYFVQPTIFANATDDMTIVKEEIFGPV